MVLSGERRSVEVEEPEDELRARERSEIVLMEGIAACDEGWMNEVDLWLWLWRTL